MSQFSETLHRQQENDQRSVEQAQNAEALQELLTRISASPEGADFNEWLPEDMAATCEEFLEAAEEMGWPNAEEIELRQHRLGRPVWRTPGKYQDQAKGKLLNTATTRQVGSWRGYHIANLRIGDEAIPARVMLCDDGLLRCERVQPTFTKSYGEGFGEMPDGVLLQTKGYLPLCDDPNGFAKFMAGKLKGSNGYTGHQQNTDQNTRVRQPQPKKSEALATYQNHEVASQNARFIAGSAGAIALSETIDLSDKDETHTQESTASDTFDKKVADQLQAEIENLRKYSGMDDKKIYRFMVKKYHTDLENSQFTEEAMRFLNTYFESRNNKS